jgi:hypothetical protein
MLSRLNSLYKVKDKHVFGDAASRPRYLNSSSPGQSKPVVFPTSLRPITMQR